MSQFCHYIKFAKVASSAAYLHKPAHRTKEPKAVEIFCLHVWVCFHSHTTSNWKPWPLPEKCLSSKGRGSALRERGKAAPASLYCHGLAAFTSRGEQPSKARKAVLKTPGTPFWEPTYLYYTTTVPQFIKNIFPVFFKVASCNVRFLVFFTHTGSLGTVVWHQDMIFFLNWSFSTILTWVGKTKKLNFEPRPKMRYLLSFMEKIGKAKWDWLCSHLAVI
jgi:hypothetical protein